MRRCPRCYHFMRLVTKNDVGLETCPNCNGAWFDQEALAKVSAGMRRVQMEWEMEHNPPRPRPGLYDLDHLDTQRPCMSKAERDKRWLELLEMFE